MIERPRTLGVIVEQMVRVNLRLWHMEDEARSTDDDQKVANAKRHINDLNSERNRLIEEYDAALAHYRDRVPE